MKKIPLQVYLDARDRKLLGDLAKQHGLSMAETLRAAIRRWWIQSEGREDPVLDLVGSMDDTGLPRDLSTRHDQYAVHGLPRHVRKVAERPRRKAR